MDRIPTHRLLRRPHVLVGALLFLLGVVSTARASAPLDEVLASVNQSLVTRRDVLLHATDIRLRDGQLWGVPLEQLAEELVPDMIEEWVLYYHFFRAGDAMAEEDLIRQMEADWNRYVRLAGSPERLRIYLADEGLRPDEMRIWLKERARRREVINRGLVLGIDPALLNRQDDSPAEAERFLLSEIFIRPLVNSDDGWQEAAERAALVRLRVTEGMAFEQAAAIFSDDERTARDGGQLGWIRAEALAPPLREALTSSPVRGMTPPIRGDRGFHILQMMDFETEARRNAWEAYLAVRDRVLTQALGEVDVLSRIEYQTAEDATDVDREVWELHPTTPE